MGAIPPLQVTVARPPGGGAIVPPPPTVKRVKFVCGNHEPALSGQHFTALNVLNPYNVPTPLRGRYAWTKEFIVDQPEPRRGAAPAVKTPAIPFALASMASIQIDCADVAYHLVQSRVLPQAEAQDIKGYIVIQAPCVPIGSPTRSAQLFHCFDPVIDTIYEVVGGAVCLNKVLFEVGEAVGENLPASTPLEIVIRCPEQGVPLDLVAHLRALLQIPARVGVKILDVDVTCCASSVSLDVEPTRSHG